MGYKSKLAILVIFGIVLMISKITLGQQLYVQVPISVGGGMDFDSLKYQLQKRGVNYGTRQLVASAGNFYNLRVAVDSLMEYGYEVDLFISATDTQRVSGTVWPDVIHSNIYSMAERVALYTGVPCDSSVQVLYPLGNAPKDSVQIYCRILGSLVYRKTIHFVDPTAGVVDTIRNYK